MKKLNVKKGNKQGVILVIVLFILAMAMIFISAALMLTNATRGRVYNNAESDQARLTVTAAAEAFYQAIVIQEIPDDTVQKLADANATVKLEMENATVPGMTTDDHNKTTLKIYHPAGLGSKYVYCDFTTIIDDKVENARIVLYENDPPSPKGLFVNQVDYNGSLNNNFRGAIGAGAPSTAKDNIIVWRGDYHSNQSEGTVTTSDMLFLGKTSGTTKVYFENNESIKGDLIFLDDVMLDWSSTAPTITGDVYFLGPKGLANSFTNNVGSASRVYGNSASTWTFVNRKINADTTPNNVMNSLKGTKGTLVLKSNWGLEPSKDGSGNWTSTNASSIQSTGDFQSKMTAWNDNYSSKYSAQITKAKKYYTSNKKDIVADYPSTSDMKNDCGIPVAVSDCTGYTTTTMASIISTYGNQDKFVPGGNYVISGDTSSWGDPYVGGMVSQYGKKVVFLDGNQSYIFFINESLSMEGVVFCVVNPNAAKQQYFIMAKDKNLTINSDNSKGKDVNCGFISIERKNGTNAYSEATLATYRASINGWQMSSTDSYHDGKKVPSVYIYGVGNNKITLKGGTVIEGYIGLFDSTNTSSSQIFLSNVARSDFRFYGRVMAPNIITTSSDFDMPYCPSPNSDPSEDKEMTSLYSVVDFLYYY